MHNTEHGVYNAEISSWHRRKSRQQWKKDVEKWNENVKINDIFFFVLMHRNDCVLIISTVCHQIYVPTSLCAESSLAYFFAVFSLFIFHYSENVTLLSRFSSTVYWRLGIFNVISWRWTELTEECPNRTDKEPIFVWIFADLFFRLSSSQARLCANRIWIYLFFALIWDRIPNANRPIPSYR